MKKIFSRGFFRLLFAGLAIMVVLACAGGQHYAWESPTRFFDGTIIPSYIRDRFVPIKGTQVSVTLGTINDTSIGEPSMTIETYTESFNDFYMMDTEVTIQMYTEFLNTNIEESATVDDVLFRNEMQNESLCGIYRTDAQNGLVSEEILALSGDGIIVTSDTSDDFLPLKPTIDPLSPNGRSKARMASETYLFHVAPGRGEYPIVFVDNASVYYFAKWLGGAFRPPSEGEWEYVARTGKENVDFTPVSSASFTGIRQTTDMNSFYSQMHNLCNFKGEYSQPSYSIKVRSYAPNDWGIYDMMGNVNEIVLASAGSFDSAGSYESYAKGGSWNSVMLSELTTWNKVEKDSLVIYADVGFRLIYDSVKYSVLGGN